MLPEDAVALVLFEAVLYILLVHVKVALGRGDPQQQRSVQKGVAGVLQCVRWLVDEPGSVAWQEPEHRSLQQILLISERHTFQTYI